MTSLYITLPIYTYYTRMFLNEKKKYKTAYNNAVHNHLNIND